MYKPIDCYYADGTLVIISNGRPECDQRRLAGLTKRGYRVRMETDEEEDRRAVALASRIELERQASLAAAAPAVDTAKGGSA